MTRLHVLMPDEALSAVEDYETGRFSIPQLATKWFVCETVMQKIVLGVYYPDVRGSHFRPGRGRPRVLTPDQVQAIRDAYNAGELTTVRLSSMYGVSETSIKDAVNGDYFIPRDKRVRRYAGVCP